jgi:hypothetical protein
VIDASPLSEAIETPRSGGLPPLSGTASLAQQPFVTDDAEVTPRGRFHFEYANEFYILQKDAYPNLRQDTSNFVIQYGLFDGLEVNMDFPLIAIGNAQGSGTPSVCGLGDVNFAAKRNMVREIPGSSRPALTVTAAAEFPTGSKKKQLGSGLADYVLNAILQKTFSDTALQSTPASSSPATRRQASSGSGLPAIFSSEVSRPLGTYPRGSVWAST